MFAAFHVATAQTLVGSSAPVNNAVPQKSITSVAAFSFHELGMVLLSAGTCTSNLSF